MDYIIPAAHIVMVANGAAVMWCEAADSKETVIFGPYSALPAGVWSVRHSVRTY